MARRGEVKFGSGARGGQVIDSEHILSMRLTAADVSNTIFTSKDAYELVAVREAHAVAGGAAATVTLEKLTGTQAPGAGTVMLASAFDLTGAANTVVAGTLSATAANLKLAAGDRMALKFAGTLTGLVGAITIYFRRI